MSDAKDFWTLAKSRLADAADAAKAPANPQPVDLQQMAVKTSESLHEATAKGATQLGDAASQVRDAVASTNAAATTSVAHAAESAQEQLQAAKETTTQSFQKATDAATQQVEKAKAAAAPHVEAVSATAQQAIAKVAAASSQVVQTVEVAQKEHARLEALALTLRHEVLSVPCVGRIFPPRGVSKELGRMMMAALRREEQALDRVQVQELDGLLKVEVKIGLEGPCNALEVQREVGARVLAALPKGGHNSYIKVIVADLDVLEMKPEAEAV